MRILFIRVTISNYSVTKVDNFDFSEAFSFSFQANKRDPVILVLVVDFRCCSEIGEDTY